MVVDLISHRKPDGATESTVFGPFHRLGAPELPAGGNIAHLDKTGTPTLVSGRVLDLDGQPIAGALLDVWQTQSSGLYDSQDESLEGELHMRGRFRTDAEGRYLIRTVLPVNYPIPSDGPVGAMPRSAPEQRNSHRKPSGLDVAFGRRFVLVEIELDLRAARVMEKQLPNATAGQAPQLIIDALAFQGRDGGRQVLGGERHVVENAAPVVRQILAVDHMQ